ncbi:MAG: pyridoxal-phosphate dependent enzyme [Phycisphaerales bacterium]
MPSTATPPNSSAHGSLNAPLHTPGGDVFVSVLDMIGRTPMLELTRLFPSDSPDNPAGCRVFAKLELLNPAQSIKDRIGLSMIEGAERDGRLNPNGNPPPTIVEATAGNTGLGLALVAGQKGYRLKVVVPDKMSQEKIQHLRAMGAEVVLARSDVQKGHPEYYQEVAARLAKDTPNSVYINQFSNNDNTRAHYEHTGPEIWDQMQGNIDAFITGVGSGGTLSGCGRYLREKNPGVKLVLADPAGSMLHPLVNEGKHVTASSWLIEGMGEDFVPDICDIKLADEAVAVTDGEAFHAARDLLKAEGILAGSSTGCLIHAARVFLRKQTKPLRVATFACDTGAKYLSKMFNDFWMVDNGFIKRDHRDDLTDLVARRHQQREDYTLDEANPLKQAIKRMGMYGVSQMVVMDARDKIAGIIDEGDILLAVTADPANFEKPVSDFMTRRLETIRPTASVNDLMPIFRADRVAIVVDEKGQYHGLITKIDLINYLRAKLVR